MDEQELRRLIQECQEALTEPGKDRSGVSVVLDVTFSDRSTEEYMTLDEFLSYENPWKRRITKLEVRAETRAASITCKFGLEKFGKSGSLITSDSRQGAYAIASRIEDRLRNMREWYPSSFAWWIMFATVAFYMAVLYVLQETYGFVFESVRSDGTVVLTRIGAAAFSGVFVALVAGVIFGRCVFPDLVFRIGYGIRRSDLARSVRSRILWIIVGGVIVALVLWVARPFIDWGIRRITQ